MTDRFREAREATTAAVLLGPGVTPPELRQQIARGQCPDDLRALVTKIRAEAHTVTDEDWAPLASRYTEDELFELVIAAAVGTAGDRLKAALRAVEGAS